MSYTDTFGAYRADMKGHRHEGNDIFAKMGTPIVAVLAGTISYSTYGIGGNNAHLTDAAGDYFYYAHMERFAAGLKPGDHVAGAGDRLRRRDRRRRGHVAALPLRDPPERRRRGRPLPLPPSLAGGGAGIGPAATHPGRDARAAGVGIPSPTILARRGVIVGVEFGRAGAALAPQRGAPRHAAARRPGAPPVVSSLGGVGAIKRLREPADSGTPRRARDGRAAHRGDRRAHAHEVLTLPSAILAARARQDTGSRGAMAKESILVVDDEREILELVKYNLAKEGYSVVCVETGEDALSAARLKLPDLVLLDLMLPGVDGLEVCRKLKADPKTQDIPVVMLTAKGGEADIVAGLELGADDYVTKPFSPRVLTARIKAVLRRDQTENGDGQATIKIRTWSSIRAATRCSSPTGRSTSPPRSFASCCSWPTSRAGCSRDSRSSTPRRATTCT